MQFYTMLPFPFVVDYYKTENKALLGNPPQWEDTLLKTINVQLANDPTAGKIQMLSQEELVIGYSIKNIRDADGHVLYAGQPNALGIETAAWRIDTCDPIFSMFGTLTGFRIQMRQLNPFRTV
jgi:hypothetical protein